METTELFDFRFVNRTEQQDKFNNFFKNKSEKTLWISGGRGCGKTAFFYHTYDGWKDYALCYFDIKINDIAVDILSNFMTKLQQHCHTDFMFMVKEKYKAFYNGIYKSTKNITAELVPDISALASIILDLSYTAITIQDERKSPVEFIIDFIHLILKEKKLCICIDDFSRCDIETAQILIQIFKIFNSEKYFRSCILTTSEDLDSEFKNAIFKNLPCTMIEIPKLEDYIYFYQILNPKFELEDFEKQDIEYIYRKCEGSPKKLMTLISKLLENNGIALRTALKAKIKKKTLFSILQEEHIHFNEKDFTASQKWVIFSYLCLSEAVKVEYLLGLALYIAQKCYLYSAYNEQIFQKELLELVNNNILRYNMDNMVSHCHDADYEDLLDIFQKSQIEGLFSRYAYEFIKLHTDCPERQKLMCKHARNAKISGWERMNFRYGKELADNKQFYDAKNIFSYLEKCFYKLHVMQKLFIALNSYEAGSYSLAIEQLELVNSEELKFKKAKYYYYFFLGKSYNNIGNVQKGVYMLENALKQVDVDSKEYVQTLNVLHMFYFELPEKATESYRIFQRIKDNYKTKYPVIWANTMRGCHNFLDDQEAMEVLKEADSLLEDEVEKAYLKTTLGFVYIRLNDIEQAKNRFEIACADIKRIKIHEYSYAANNLALCYMLDGDYRKAKEILLEAFLWNRTDYGRLVLQVHLMVCTISLHQWQEAQEYYNYLERYMEKYKPADDILNRKVYLNLAIASKKLDLPLREKLFFDKAGKYVENTTSEWRYYMLSGQTGKPQSPYPAAKYQLTQDFDPWFLVYAHD